LAYIVSIAITDPVADPEIAVDETFTFEVTATMSDSSAAIYEQYFEYDNGTNQAEWFSIPAAGGGLTCPAPNPVTAVWEQGTGNVNSKTVTGKVADTYYIRGRTIEDPPLGAESFTDVQLVTVSAGGYEFLCTGAGGAATSGAAGFEFDYVLGTSGGAVANGSADVEYGHVYATSGGATASGGADYKQAWTVAATGGGTTSGAAEYSVGHNWTASGSATTSGAADVIFGHVYAGVGGAQTSGEASVEVIAYEFEHIASGGATTSGVALHVRYLDGGTGTDHQYKSAYRLRDSESADRGGIWHSNKFCNIESTARKRDWQSSYRAKE